MISPHLPTGTLPAGVSRQQSAEQIALYAIAELQDFITLRPDAPEVRKALAVKLVYQGYLYDEIQTILDVSRGSITAWKQSYVPVVNERDKQTYYGAVDYLLGELVLKANEAGNSKNTIDYLEYLLANSPDQRLLIFWDGSSYHCSKEIRGFLDSVNQSLPTEQWKIHCVRFAPNCPVQNPIEDIWLQAKTWVRRFCALAPSFSHLKWIFEWFIRHTTFDFDTLQMYGAYSKIK
ncbi:MAG: transposase [Nostoc sp.]